MELVDGAQVVGDASEGGAPSFGHTVVDQDDLVFLQARLKQ